MGKCVSRIVWQLNRIIGIFPDMETFVNVCIRVGQKSSLSMFTSMYVSLSLIKCQQLREKFACHQSPFFVWKKKKNANSKDRRESGNVEIQISSQCMSASRVCIHLMEIKIVPPCKWSLMLDVHRVGADFWNS